MISFRDIFQSGHTYALNMLIFKENLTLTMLIGFIFIKASVFSLPHGTLKSKHRLEVVSTKLFFLS